jgi:hypothetical protein
MQQKSPFVEVLMLDDHVIVQQEEELVAAGFLLRAQ